MSKPPKAGKSLTLPFDPAAIGAALFGARIEGFVDRIIADEAFGWAIDHRRPGRRVLVVARHEGEVVAETLADLPRRDLEEAGKGDGRCGFRLKLPPALTVEQQAAVRIEAVSGLRRQALKRPRRFRHEPLAKAPGPLEEADRGPSAGFLERFVAGTVKGWAFDPNDPETPTSVDLFDGEQFLGAAPAHIERPRLRESGAPAGARGFEFKVPDGLTVAPDRLRARITGSRIDLRRSRSYPGDIGGYGDDLVPATAPAVAPAAPDPRRPDGPAPPPPRPASDRIAFIVSGEGAAEAAARIGQGQNRRDVIVAVVSAEPAPAGVRHVGPDDGQALGALIDEAHSVVFVQAGDFVHPDLAHWVFEHDLLTDALAWTGEDGARQAGFAVRAAALDLSADVLARGLADQGLAAIATWAAGAGLSWDWAAAPGAGTPPRLLAMPMPRPPLTSCRRVSLAVWSGWGEAPPPALAGLLRGAEGLDVEVLLPAPATSGLPDAVRAQASAARSLDFRVVDAPAGLGEAGWWRAMAEAATGQVVVLCAGAVEPAPESVREAVRWAAAPGIGCVAVALVGGDQPRTPTIDLDPRAVPGARAALMAVSRAALAQAGGFDPSLGRLADLELGRRLWRAGRGSIRLRGHRAKAPAELVSAWPVPTPNARDAPAP